MLCNINEIPDVFLSPKIKGIILKLEYTLKENKMLFEWERIVELNVIWELALISSILDKLVQKW